MLVTYNKYWQSWQRDIVLHSLYHTDGNVSLHQSLMQNTDRVGNVILFNMHSIIQIAMTAYASHPY